MIFDAEYDICQIWIRTVADVQVPRPKYAKIRFCLMGVVKPDFKGYTAWCQMYHTWIALGTPMCTGFDFLIIARWLPANKITTAAL